MAVNIIKFIDRDYLENTYKLPTSKYDLSTISDNDLDYYIQAGSGVVNNLRFGKLAIELMDEIQANAIKYWTAYLVEYYLVNGINISQVIESVSFGSFSSSIDPNEPEFIPKNIERGLKKVNLMKSITGLSAGVDPFEDFTTVGNVPEEVKEYVDQQDQLILLTANGYTDSRLFDNYIALSDTNKYKINYGITDLLDMSNKIWGDIGSLQDKTQHWHGAGKSYDAGIDGELTMRAKKISFNSYDEEINMGGVLKVSDVVKHSPGVADEDSAQMGQMNAADTLLRTDIDINTGNITTNITDIDINSAINLEQNLRLDNIEDALDEFVVFSTPILTDGLPTVFVSGSGSLPWFYDVDITPQPLEPNWSPDITEYIPGKTYSFELENTEGVKVSFDMIMDGDEAIVQPGGISAQTLTIDWKLATPNTLNIRTDSEAQPFNSYITEIIGRGGSGSIGDTVLESQVLIENQEIIDLGFTTLVGWDEWIRTDGLAQWDAIGLNTTGLQSLGLEVQQNTTDVNGLQGDIGILQGQSQKQTQADGDFNQTVKGIDAVEVDELTTLKNVNDAATFSPNGDTTGKVNEFDLVEAPSYGETTLWTGTLDTAGQIATHESLDNYDMISFVVGHPVGEYGTNIMISPKQIDRIIQEANRNIIISDDDNHIIIVISTLKTSTTAGIVNGLNLIGIYGHKF